nr:MAG TPA: hypothetical protein [Caudoviricetes sp.]
MNVAKIIRAAAGCACAMLIAVVCVEHGITLETPEFWMINAAIFVITLVS